MPRELWNRIQQRLNENAGRGRGSSNRSISSPLAGKVFDSSGQPLYVQGAVRRGRRYRYYVSKSLVNGSAADNDQGWRLSAPELERTVAIAARHLLSDRVGLLQALESSDIDAPDPRAILESASSLLIRLQNESDAAACLVELISRVELRSDGIALTLGIQVLSSHVGVTPNTLNLFRFVPVKMKRRGLETRIILATGGDLPRKVDRALLKAIARSRAWFEELACGRVRSLADIARREKITRRYVERLSRLAFIAPAIVTAICQGRQPAALSTETLLNRIDLPLEWSAQPLAERGDLNPRDSSGRLPWPKLRLTSPM